MRATDLNTAVFAFGRLNPPTIGHGRLVDVVKNQPGKPFLFLTHTQKPNTDPLTFQQKLKYAKASFDGIIIGYPDVKTIIQALQKLESLGFAHVILVAGSDRVKQFESFLTKYNGKDYNFESVKVMSSGERDPDAEGIEGMSASKMREHARKGEFDKFNDGVINQKIAKQMYKDVRAGMNIPTETTESTEEEAWELLGQQEPNIQKFVKTLGLQNNQQSVEKLVPMIRNAQTSIINPNQIATLQNLANKGPADIQALRSILKIKGTPEAPQQFAKIMQQRDQAEGRHRGYDVGRLINDINTGKYELPVVLKTNSGMVVVGGRTRLYAALALNKSIKVKVLDPNKLNPAEGIQEEVSQKPKVYVDMDGVIADFFSALAKFRKVNHWKDQGGEMSVEDSIKMIAGTEFFYTLPVFPTAKQLITMVQSFTGGEWYICSSPLRGDHENSKKHKLRWLRDNGFSPTGTIITGRKESYAVNKTNGIPNILIDDKPSNIERWIAKGGIGIRYQANKDNLSRILIAFKLVETYFEKNDSITSELVSKMNQAVNTGKLVEHGGRIVKGINTTHDVGIDAIKKQSAKLGFNVDNDGYPPKLREELKFQNKSGDKSLLTLPGTKKFQKMKKTSSPGTEKWFKAYRTLPYLTKGRKNHYMLPVKEQINILENQIKQLKEKWSEKYKKAIDCSNPKGFSQKAHCAGRKKKQ